MNKHRAMQLRSKGEAHLYVAVAKADGEVSRNERIRAPYFAGKSQRRFGMLKVNRRLGEMVKADVRAILDDRSTAEWPAERHLEEGLMLLRRAKESGSLGLSLTGHRIEKELHDLAYMDGYDMRESRFVTKVIQALRELD